MSKKQPRSGAKTVARRAPAIRKTSQATIFIYYTPSGLRVRTSPHYMTAGPGYVEWTVVNLTSAATIPVTISWPEGGPWGKKPIVIKNGCFRCRVDGIKGRFKYHVTAAGFTEDPELEMPEM